MDINRNASAVAFQRYGVKSNVGGPEAGATGPADVQEHLGGVPPLATGTATFGSVAQTTAWRSQMGDTPQSYSRQTRGTTLSFDEAPARPQIS
jgi:hypothetical protein